MSFSLNKNLNYFSTCSNFLFLNYFPQLRNFKEFSSHNVVMKQKEKLIFEVILLQILERITTKLLFFICVCIHKISVICILIRFYLSFAVACLHRWFNKLLLHLYLTGCLYLFIPMCPNMASVCHLHNC